MEAMARKAEAIRESEKRRTADGNGQELQDKMDYQNPSCLEIELS
jgi:hypothetical protein